MSLLLQLSAIVSSSEPWREDSNRWAAQENEEAKLRAAINTLRAETNELRSELKLLRGPKTDAILGHSDSTHVWQGINRHCFTPRIPRPLTTVLRLK